MCTTEKHGYQSSKSGKTFLTKHINDLHVLCIKKHNPPIPISCAPSESEKLYIYQVLRVLEELLARHLAEVVQLQST